MVSSAFFRAASRAGTGLRPRRNGCALRVLRAAVGRKRGNAACLRTARTGTYLCKQLRPGLRCDPLRGVDRKDPHSKPARAGTWLQAISGACTVLRRGEHSAARARTGALWCGSARRRIFRLPQPHDAVRRQPCSGEDCPRASGGITKNTCRIGGVQILTWNRN